MDSKFSNQNIDFVIAIFINQARHFLSKYVLNLQKFIKKGLNLYAPNPISWR